MYVAKLCHDILVAIEYKDTQNSNSMVLDITYLD